MKNINLIDIGTRIKHHREIAGYTREIFAEKINKSVGFCSELERGSSGLSNDTLVKISDLLNISCDYILKGSNYDNDISAIVEMLENSNENDYGHLERVIFHYKEILKKNDF